MARLPVAAPAVVGRKVETRTTDWPAGMVLGVVMPLTLNSEPVCVSIEIVRSAPPLLETVRFEFACEPTETDPKSMLELLKEIWGWGLTAFAERFIATGAGALFACAVNVPLTTPAAVGVTETEKLTLCPAASVAGSVTPE